MNLQEIQTSLGANGYTDLNTGSRYARDEEGQNYTDCLLIAGSKKDGILLAVHALQLRESYESVDYSKAFTTELAAYFNLRLTEKATEEEATKKFTDLIGDRFEIDQVLEGDKTVVVGKVKGVSNFTAFLMDVETLRSIGKFLKKWEANPVMALVHACDLDNAVKTKDKKVIHDTIISSNISYLRGAASRGFKAPLPIVPPKLGGSGYH